MANIVEDYDNLLRMLFTEDTLDGIFNGLVFKMQGIAGGLAALFFLIGVVWEYGKSTINGGGWMFKWSELSRLLMLWLLIGILPALLSIPHLVSESLRKATVGLSDSANIAEYSRSIDLRQNFVENITSPDLQSNSYTTQSVEKDDEGNVNEDQNANNNSNSTANKAEVQTKDVNSKGESSSIWDVVELVGGGVGGAIGFIITEIVLFITQVAKTLIVAFCISGSKILFVMSPLAVVFSMLPWSKDKLGEWFGFYLSLLFTPVTCNIIDAVTLHLFYHDAKIFGSADGANMDLFTTCAINLTILILYIYAFGLTRLYVGSADAGRALNQGVQTLMQGYTMFNTAKMANSMSGEGGGGGSAADAAKAGQDALKK